MNLMMKLALALTSSLVFATESAALTQRCVSTEAQLRAAMDEAETTNDDFQILMVQGTYTLTANATFSVPVAGSGNMSTDLQLLGGYAAGCASRTVNPLNTVVNGQNLRCLLITTAPGRDLSVKISGLTLFNLTHDSTAACGVGNDNGLWMVSQGGNETLRFQNNMAVGIQGGSSLFAGGGSDARIESNLFRGNAASGSECPLRVISTDSDVVIAGNTLVGNSGGLGALCLRSNTGIRQLYNNVLRSNAPVDVFTLSDSGGISWALFNNMFQTSGGLAPAGSSSGNSSADPLFVNPGAQNYQLQVGSPAINSGSMAVTGGLNSLDVAGQARLVGSIVDRGAHESSIDNLTDIVVSSSDDAGAGSLRAAITAANANANPNRIVFALGGSCQGASPTPVLIFLASALPDITSSITVDGWSQSGSINNTAALSMNARHCIWISSALTDAGPVNANHAFRVPAGTANSVALNVQGIAFGRFASSVIELSGGAGHRIQGNQFSGLLNGSGGMPSSPNHVYISGATQSLIGGTEPEQRNTFNEPNQEAVVITGVSSTLNEVRNNFFGVGRNGLANEGSLFFAGIRISDGSDNQITGNWIGNFGAGVSIANGANNSVQSNSIGVAPNGGAAANTRGVHLSGIFAVDNVIGAQGSAPGQGNRIENNTNVGVWIQEGLRNRVRANRLLANGGGAGLGLQLDLGAIGVTANDNNDVDAGANALQNFPSVTTATPGGGGLIVGGLLNSVANVAYTIDVYFNSSCHPSTRGGGIHLGGFAHAAVNANNISWMQSVAAPPASAGFLSATATDAAGNSSEIGACFAFSTDAVFANSFE